MEVFVGQNRWVMADSPIAIHTCRAVPLWSTDGPALVQDGLRSSAKSDSLDEARYAFRVPFDRSLECALAAHPASRSMDETLDLGSSRKGSEGSRPTPALKPATIFWTASIS